MILDEVLSDMTGNNNKRYKSCPWLCYPLSILVIASGRRNFSQQEFNARRFLFASRGGGGGFISRLGMPKLIPSCLYILDHDSGARFAGSYWSSVRRLRQQWPSFLRVFHRIISGAEELNIP